ncbi:MAG: hypothetical protein ACRDI0_07235 [Actinomycetota bacterium]
MTVLIAAPLLLAHPTMAGSNYESTAKLKLIGHLTAKVTVVAQGDLVTGPPNPKCEESRKVVIQRKKAGKWTKVEAGKTGSPFVQGQTPGVYKSGIPDKAGKYRVVAKKKAVSGGVCVRAVSKIIKHTH